MARFDTKVKVGEGTTQKEVTVESLVKTLLNESIKDPKAPTHQRPTHQRQGRMFYLRISEKGKYLTAYHKDSGHWNTCKWLLIGHDQAELLTDVWTATK